MADPNISIFAARNKSGFVIGKVPISFSPAGKRSCVYAIFNTVSGRIYIGSSQRTDQRWHTHLWQLKNGIHHAMALQRSWRKHGPLVFSWEVLENVHETNALFLREQYWLDRLGGFHPVFGANSLPQAGGPRGAIRSEHFREKRRLYMTGRKMPPHSMESREAIRQARLGSKASDETKAKMSASHKGRRHSAETREKLRLAKLGKPMPAGFGAKISAARKAMFKMKKEQNSSIQCSRGIAGPKHPIN